MLAVVALVLAQVSAPTFGASRPAECGVVEGFRATNVWERAKEPQLRRYCDLLAKGAARLVGAGPLAHDVLGIADEAERLMPRRAGPSVLRGRALLRLGRDRDALAALEEARARDERAMDDPVTLLAWARANARTGHADVAARAYRAALPRASALSAQDRSAASFEAGFAVMAHGAAQVEDAAAMFRQARRDAQDAMQVAAVVGLALALDRAGQREEARAILAERVRHDVRPLLSDTRVSAALADAGASAEAHALAALASESTGDTSGARDSWRKYVEGPGGRGPWAEHARAHEGALGSPSPPRGPR